MAETTRYWQIAAGDGARDYTHEFLRYGIAFVGGGEKAATMAKVQLGDRLLLKRGMSEVVAVGEVVVRDERCSGNAELDDDPSKDWLRDFDGWDLPAYCYVHWCPLDQPQPTHGLTRGTILQTHSPALRNLAEALLESIPPASALPPQPRPTAPVRDEQILEELVDAGLRPGTADDLVDTFGRIRLLARYYYKRERDLGWEHVREHETRTFLVIPLLLALGWSEQQIKIELPVARRTRADVACFAHPYRTKDDKDCALIVETKGFAHGLDLAAPQAKEYAEHFPVCSAIAVTNGYCYKTFRKGDGGLFPEGPTAHLNLLRPRDRYPLDPDRVDGCVAALKMLMPGAR